MTDASDPDFPTLELVRKTHRTIEPVHAVIYFAPEAGAAYTEAGIPGAAGYFASRSAALGVVPAPVIAALFFNFNPELVATAMADAWTNATPEVILAARHGAADATLRRLLTPEVLTSPEMLRAAELAEAPAREATHHLEGRPLFAAHAALDWPEAPHMRLWHAITLLREFRGDVHIAALLTAGLDGLDALIVHAASGTIPRDFLRLTRGWSDEQWDAMVAFHQETGWLTDTGELTEDGVALREQIEIATDRGTAGVWSTIGAQGCEELRTLVRPWARTLADAMFAGFGAAGT